MDVVRTASTFVIGWVIRIVIITQAPRVLFSSLVTRVYRVSFGRRLLSTGRVGMSPAIFPYRICPSAVFVGTHKRALLSQTRYVQNESDGSASRNEGERNCRLFGIEFSVSSATGSKVYSPVTNERPKTRIIAGFWRTCRRRKIT